jgi:hypothetical protein
MAHYFSTGQKSLILSCSNQLLLKLLRFICSLGTVLAVYTTYSFIELDANYKKRGAAQWEE